MRIGFAHVPVRHDQSCNTQPVQRFKHLHIPFFIHGGQYLVQHQQVQPLVTLAITVYQLLHSQDGGQIHSCLFPLRELAEAATIHPVTD